MFKKTVLLFSLIICSVVSFADDDNKFAKITNNGTCTIFEKDVSVTYSIDPSETQSIPLLPHSSTDEMSVYVDPDPYCLKASITNSITIINEAQNCTFTYENDKSKAQQTINFGSSIKLSGKGSDINGTLSTKCAK